MHRASSEHGRQGATDELGYDDLLLNPSGAEIRREFSGRGTVPHLHDQYVRLGGSCMFRTRKFS